MPSTRSGCAPPRRCARSESCSCSTRRPRSRSSTGSTSREHAMLEGEILEHRFDHEIARLRSPSSPSCRRRGSSCRRTAARVICCFASRSCTTSRTAASPLPTRAVSVSLSRTSVPCCTAIDAIPAPMKPAPSTPSLSTCARRGAGAVDAGILLERVGGEEQKDELARHVGHRHLAEQPRLLAKPPSMPRE